MPLKLIAQNILAGVLVCASFSFLYAQDAAPAKPVAQVVSFTGLSEQYDNVISWASVAESNCAYYTVERSCDHLVWEDAVKLKGEGNSAQQLSYNCKDEAPYNGYTFYRLKEVAADGSYTYSQSIVVESKMHISVDVQPNPASGLIKVIVFGPENENSKLYIKNMMGQPVFSVDIMNNAELEVDIDSFPEGIYTVVAESKAGTTAQRLVKR